MTAVSQPELFARPPAKRVELDPTSWVEILPGWFRDAELASISATENDAVARAYPFGRFAKLVDVGGAHGHLLAALGHCRDALADGGRVLVVDRMIRPGNHPDWSKWLDVNMLVGPGGQERSAREFRALFEAAGLELVKVHPTHSPLSIVEAARA